MIFDAAKATCFPITEIFAPLAAVYLVLSACMLLLTVEIPAYGKAVK